MFVPAVAGHTLGQLPTAAGRGLQREGGGREGGREEGREGGREGDS